eukprot:TRINITY_DN7180_c0_g1_i1.p1 TRINITY_DN7180_c0_g1~~TRINITY_DN7180_c0_g1_i1.p1  ORF type:complete len:248 (-),score=48.48 TRINITY_DN7180_c0_g1_i1:52-795(-)
MPSAMPALASISAFFSLALFGGLWQGSEAAHGALALDNYTLDKVLDLLDVPCLVKFDKPYPYGEMEDEFKALCKLASPGKSFDVAEVSVSPYGNKENEDLADRFKLTETDYPAYLLFSKGDKEGLRYTGAITADAIATWLRSKNIHVAIEGSLPEMDAIVKRFFTGGMATSEIDAAKKLAIEQFSTDRKASMYVKIMEKVKQIGESYIAKESTRVGKLMESKMTPEKIGELSDKLKVLSVFASKDEL